MATVTQKEMINTIADKTGIVLSTELDLNELFRLAEKLDSTGLDFYHRGKVCQIYRGDVFPSIRGEGDNPAEALLNALYEAIKETL